MDTKRALGALVVLGAVASFSRPAAAQSCGARRSGDASSSGSSSSSDGSAAGSVVGSILGALFSGGSPSRSATRLVLPNVELALSAEFQSLDLGSATFTGWGEHPYLANYVGGAPAAAGSTFGLGRVDLLGGGLQFSFIPASRVLVGVRGGLYGQSDLNDYAPGPTRGIYLSGGFVAEGALFAGGVFPLGPVTVRATLQGGYRHASFRLNGMGEAGCTSIPTVTTTQWLVQPRLSLELNLASAVSIGATGAMDLLHLGDISVGGFLSFHGPGYAR